MRLFKGSDWLLLQEQKARKRISELQVEPPAWVEQRQVPIVRSVDGEKYNFMYWILMLPLMASFVSFCMMFFTTDRELRLGLELFAMPILLLISVFVEDMGEYEKLYQGYAFGATFFIILMLFILNKMRQRPFQKKYRTSKKEIRRGETLSQKEARLAELAKWEEKLANVTAGRQGEEQTAVLLQSFLNDNWILYRNITLPDGRNDDIDAVLVGPPGVFTLEIKVYSGLHRYQGDTWEVYLGKDTWKEKEWNPALQSQHGAERLRDFLALRGLNLNVQPRVVWAGKGEVRIVGSPAVLFWFIGNTEWIKKDLLGRRSVLSFQEEEFIRKSLTSS